MTATSTANGTFPTEPGAAVELYLLKSLAPIPLPTREKDPGYPDWQNLHVTLETMDRHFPPGQQRNVGILNGTPSANHVDVDLDAQQARDAAPYLLSQTGWKFGRESSPCSHWIFKVDFPLNSAQVAFEDLGGNMLLELRGTGGLTVYPPSRHRETGERIEWHTFTEPAAVRLEDLERAVRELAAAALLARHWPAKGSRDRAAMALSGGLLGAGWDPDKVSRFVEAVAVAAGDEESRMRAGKAEPTARKQADGEQTTGWPTLAKIMGQFGPDVVDRVREWLRVKDRTRLETALPAEAPWPAPPGSEAFFGLPGKIVRTLEPASESDPAALLVQVLVCYGNVIGRGPYFLVESDRHHPNEYAVLVGRTSKARKGTSWGRIKRLFQETEELWVAERVAGGLSSGEGLIWTVRDPIKKMERVKERGKPVRYEEVEADHGVADKRLLVYEPEYANVLKQTERQGNTLSPVLRLGWDGLDLRTLTKNSPARATGAHLSLIGNITTEELRRYLTQTEAANGWGNRHLWICAERSKQLPEGGMVDARAWEEIRLGLVEALHFGRQEREMRRDAEAAVLWREMYGELSEGRPGMAGALLGRAEAHVMRLAMIYALMDRSPVIRKEHLLAGLTLWDYAQRSVYHIFGDSLGDPLADELLFLLRASPNGLTRNDLMDHFRRHQSSERIGRGLALLLRHRLVRREQQTTGGRPAERWFAVAQGRG